jgi:hypothetical protein
MPGLDFGSGTRRRGPGAGAAGGAAGERALVATAAAGGLSGVGLGATWVSDWCWGRGSRAGEARRRG